MNIQISEKQNQKIFETHKLIFNEYDKKLTKNIDRNDELMKLIITISSWIIAIAIPFVLGNRIENIFFAHLIIVCSMFFLLCIMLLIYAWDNTIKLDDKWIELYKKSLDLLNKYWYNKDTDNKYISENNKLQNDYNNDIGKQIKNIDNQRFWWLLSFFLWILFLLISISLNTYSNIFNFYSNIFNFLTF